MNNDELYNRSIKCSSNNRIYIFNSYYHAFRTICKILATKLSNYVAIKGSEGVGKTNFLYTLLYYIRKNSKVEDIQEDMSTDYLLLIENLNRYKDEKETEIKALESELAQLKKDYTALVQDINKCNGKDTNWLYEYTKQGKKNEIYTITDVKVDIKIHNGKIPDNIAKENVARMVQIYEIIQNNLPEYENIKKYFKPQLDIMQVISSHYFLYKLQLINNNKNLIAQKENNIVKLKNEIQEIDQCIIKIRNGKKKCK